jgi:ubiquinone/menaquinone biosynthesis C-methylase UbiE
MNLSLYRLCQWTGIPPSIWMIPNPLKIYEFLELTRSSDLKPTDRILDLGCGKGHWTIALGQKCAHAVGVEPDAKKIQVANDFLRRSRLKRKIKFIPSTLEKAGLPDQSIDHMFSFCVLEHIQNLHKVLVEVKRVLKPGGKIHVSVDSLTTIKNQNIISKHKKDNYVVQYFDKQTLRIQLEAAGFQVLDIYPILTSEFARDEFEKRIQQSYKYNLLKRMQISRRFLKEDMHQQSDDGIMLIAHAIRSDKE